MIWFNETHSYNGSLHKSWALEQMNVYIYPSSSTEGNGVVIQLKIQFCNSVENSSIMKRRV